MRLICPNCDAQYEVPDDVMPTEGRDVQCSNCGQTWFQAHPDHPDEENEDYDLGPQDDEEVIQTASPTVGTSTGSWAFDDTSAPADAPEKSEPQDHEFDDLAPKAAEDDMPSRRPLDPAVADVLRAEAELEAMARQKESESFESQPDLGLTEGGDDSQRRSREARERMSRMRGEPLEDEEPEEELLPAADVALASRRDLLPDIEEINSTLRSNNDRSPSADSGQTAQIEVREKRSSRRGFTLTVALVAVLTLLYAYAPSIIDAAPQAEPALTAFVDMIDGWRGWLDDNIAAMLSWLDAVAVSSSQ